MEFPIFGIPHGIPHGISKALLMHRDAFPPWIGELGRRSFANWFDVFLVLAGFADIYIIASWQRQMSQVFSRDTIRHQHGFRAPQARFINHYMRNG